MPTIAEGFQQITLRYFRGAETLLCRISDNRYKKKRLDLSYETLRDVTDLNQLCKCIAEAEDLQEVWLHMDRGGSWRPSLSTEDVSKFNLALALCPNLQILCLHRRDELSWDFYPDDGLQCSTLPPFYLKLPNDVNLIFQKLSYLSIWCDFNCAQSSQALGRFLSRCPRLFRLDLDNCGLASYFLPNWFRPDLHLLGEALLQATNLRWLSLSGNHLRWLSQKRFDAFYLPLSQCRKLITITGIEAFTIEQQDVLKGMFENNKTYISRFIDAFLPSCELLITLKRLILEFLFTEDELPATSPDPMMGLRPQAALVQKKLTFSPEAALLQKKNAITDTKIALKVRHRGFFF